VIRQLRIIAVMAAIAGLMALLCWLVSVAPFYVLGGIWVLICLTWLYWTSALIIDGFKR
jgi:hypothetical protein